jgi:hypothetical protein
MSMRALFAVAAAAWFAYNVVFVLPSDDPTRGLFAGLALLALAQIEWGEILAFFTETGKGDAADHN